MNAVEGDEITTLLQDIGSLRNFVGVPILDRLEARVRKALNEAFEDGARSRNLNEASETTPSPVNSSEVESIQNLRNYTNNLLGAIEALEASGYSLYEAVETLTALSNNGYFVGVFDEIRG